MTYRFPPVSSSTFNLGIVADTQIRRRVWLPQRLDKLSSDVRNLLKLCDGWTHVGDIQHWRENTEPENGTQITQTKSFMLPLMEQYPSYVLVPGNHDLSSFWEPFPSRSGDEWADLWGLPDKNTFKDYEDKKVRVIGISPDEWAHTGTTFGPMVLSSSTVTWLGERIREKPDYRVILVAHTPLPEHIPGHMEDSGMHDLLSDSRHSNVIAWLSGHVHPLITDSRVGVNKYFGENKIACLCLPSLSGSGELFDTKINVFSMLTLYPDNKVEVRLRDSHRRSWVDWKNSEHWVEL